MHRALRVLTIGGLLLIPAHSRADAPLLDLFRGYVESLRVQAGIPGLSVALVGRDDVLWEQAFGYQNLERSIAARADTPYHLDGLTQVFTASLVLRCVEEGRLSLDDRIGRFKPDSPEPAATIRELLSHTSSAAGAPVFAYRPERLEALASAIRACTGDSYRESLAGLLDRLAMTDSVPGADAVRLAPPAQGIPEPAAVERYQRVLQRLATPYTVDQQKRTALSQYASATLTSATGLISTVRDLARFELALKKGVLLRPGTLALAWQPPVRSDGRPLPHGLGWFAQTHNGEKIVWQFGVGGNASSSLVVAVPSRGLTFILVANSAGLVKPLPLTAGDLMASPFVRLFLAFFSG